MQLWQTAITAASPVLQIACYASCGALLAYRGALPPAGKLVLGNLSKTVLLPCLIFTKLGSTLRLDQVRSAPAIHCIVLTFLADACSITPWAHCWCSWTRYGRFPLWLYSMSPPGSCCPRR